MGIIEDLLNNNYLITPSAYYLLSPYYERGAFTLVDLIKFAKSKGTFVVTLEVAKEFMSLFGDYEKSSGQAEEPEEKSAGEDFEPLEGVESSDEEVLQEESSEESLEEYAGDETREENGELPVELIEGEPEDLEDAGQGYSVYDDLRISTNPDFHFRAAEIDPDYRIEFDVRAFKLSPPKPKNGNGKEGEILVEAYRSYFRSRLRKMRRILRENPEVEGVIDIGKLEYFNPSGEITVVGIVNEKHESRKGYVLELEDDTGRVKVFIGKDREDYKKVLEIPKDAVIAVRGRYSRRMMFAERIYIPDVPKFRKPKEPLKEKVYAVLISDIHVGSKKFCEKAFEMFLEWLNGNVENERDAELVSRIKYLIIDGDAVDGVGIYPGQYRELAIPDVFDQYEALAHLLSNVPSHITVFLGPGNHDAARMALPQPGFYEDYIHPLMKLKNVVIISNPAVINLHGRSFLIYHGRGIEDVVNEIPNRSHHRPAEATVDLLKLRHLAPTFGEKVPIAPDPEDLLVIEHVPDLFQTGHVHVMEHRIYNGVFVINTGTWQAQTEFQKMVNIVPTPARVPVIDVETARLRAVISFEQFCEGV